MSWLTLGEADQKQWGVPERVEFDLDTIGIRSIQAMKRHTGYTLDQATALAFDGKIIPQPDGTERIETDKDAYAAIVWLILYASGYREIPWAEFDPKGRGLGMHFDAPEGEEEAGKAPATDGSNTTTDS